LNNPAAVPKGELSPKEIEHMLLFTLQELRRTISSSSSDQEKEDFHSKCQDLINRAISQLGGVSLRTWNEVTVLLNIGPQLASLGKGKGKEKAIVARESRDEQPKEGDKGGPSEPSPRMTRGGRARKLSAKAAEEAEAKAHQVKEGKNLKKK
jgi:hypothetical protein